jgi:hypothetical protein
MRVSALLFALFLLVAASGSAIAAPPMIPGKWQITLQTISPIEAPPMITSGCVDKAHADKPEPPRAGASDDCQIATSKFDGTDMAYAVQCKKQRRSSETKLTFRGESYSGTVTIHDGDLVIVQRIDAVRLGECDGQ